MTTTLHTDTRNAIAAAVTGRVDAGGAGGKILVYTGVQPADPMTAPTGDLLVTFTLNHPAYAAPVNGVAALITAPAISATPVLTGTAGWYRQLDSAGNAVLDGVCGTSGAQLNLTTTALQSGVAVSIASGNITQPGS